MIMRISLLLFVLLASGCSTTIQPWERGTLAKPEMQWVSDAQGFALSKHVYFSKEGSNGGAMVVGGGCGCN
ncbi:hypothetical protein MNBD_GAMMA23-2182 [hydrothermal vent metagenome]|uniref:DUF4266 domain-containing protein n=1 Tax=hydrothermal vent metagenome TaxID=652676 RepID=A0A3B0ZKV9_9ZZZZ